MTSGERMVWAEAFVMALAEAWSNEQAAKAGGATVRRLRSVDRSALGDDDRAMFDDMLGVPR